MMMTLTAEELRYWEIVTAALLSDHSNEGSPEIVSRHAVMMIEERRKLRVLNPREDAMIEAHSVLSQMLLTRTITEGAQKDIQRALAKLEGRYKPV